MDQQVLRSLGLDHELDQDSATTKGGPGKSSLTSRLTPAPQVVFRVSDPETARALGESLSGGTRARIQRDADGAFAGRDSNGVAAGAEAAVERAASSRGAPLPAPVQRQFEQSLGADLSNVRVHTGSDSQQAAHEVGAKAYTVGNDIHFGAGYYQPDDPFGLHLLAHEVAHTVQQSGGAQRRQHKLEVSTPQDAAEHEADRAADAMVRGRPTTVGAQAGVARKPVMRDLKNLLDPTQEETAGVTPINWYDCAPVSTAEPSGEWNSAPQYEAMTYNDSRIEDGKRLFTASWSDTATHWSKAVAMMKEYKEAEAHVGPLDAIDPSKHEVKAEAQQTDAGKAFKNDKITGPEVNKGKLDPASIIALKEARDSVKAADSAIADQKDALAKGATAYNKAVLAARNATLNAKIKEKEGEKEAKEAAKTKIEHQRTQTLADLDVATQGYNTIFKLVGGLGKAAAKKDVGDLIDAGTDFAVNMNEWDTKIQSAATNRKYDNEIEAMDRAISTVSNSIRSLGSEVEENNGKAAVEDAKAATIDMKNASRKINELAAPRETAYMKYAEVLRTMAEKSGVKGPEAKQLAAAAESIPKMEAMLTLCENMERTVKPPRYTPVSGYGCAIATNRDEMMAHVGILKGFAEGIRERRTRWIKRIASTKQMIERN